MKIFVFFTLLLLLPSMVMAGLQPADFAYGMPLALKEKGAVYRLSVPDEVYQTVTRGDLADMRVFNKAQAAVPFMLQRPKIKNEIEEKTANLPFFPLYTDKNRTTDEKISVRIEKDKDGTILDIHSNGTAMDQDRKLFGYIIDASGHDQKIDALEISWHTLEKNFITAVSLEHSTDLTHWSTIVHRTTLAAMDYMGHEISMRRVQLPSKKIKYIRMLWPEGRKGFDVKHVLAVQTNEEKAPQRQWKALTGTPATRQHKSKKEIAAFEYDSGALLPADRIRLRFAEKNTILKASLFSRSDKDSQWRFRQKGIFYDLDFDQTPLLQDTMNVRQTSDRYWRVEIDKDALGDTQNIPVVELGWLPHDLLFVARGEGPFILAYGSARLSEESLKNGTHGPLAQVIGADNQTLLKEAEVLPKTVLGGSDMLEPVPPPLPWQKWLLWGVLVAGVGVVARMALSLGKDMNK